MLVLMKRKNPFGDRKKLKSKGEGSGLAGLLHGVCEERGRQAPAVFLEGGGCAGEPQHPSERPQRQSHSEQLSPTAKPHSQQEVKVSLLQSGAVIRLHRRRGLPRPISTLRREEGGGLGAPRKGDSRVKLWRPQAF